MRRIPWLLLIAGCLIAVSASAAGATDKPDVSLLSGGALAIDAKTGSDTATSVLEVFNAGPAAATLTVVFDAETPTKVRVTRFTPKTVAPDQLQQVTVNLAGLRALRKTLPGQIVVKGGAKPVSQAATVTPAPQPWTRWTLWITLLALGAIPGFMVIVYLWAGQRNKAKMLAKPAPGPKWSFQSWATTATATGALLGTVLGGSVLPAVPRQMDKNTIVLLNLLFGALVVLAPFLFQTIRKASAVPDDPDVGLWGYNWALALEFAITCGAVLGELATLILVTWELTTGVWGWLATVVIVGVAVLGARYFLITAYELATTDWKKVSKGEAKTPRHTAFRFESYVGAADQPPVVRRTWSLP